MAFWVLLIVLICVIAIGILVYRQDNRVFSQLTGYSFFDILFKSKANYFNNVMNKLDGLSGEYKILIDLTIPVDNQTMYADAIILHESGIYVMNGVNKRGWIVGAETQREWVEAMHKEQKAFNNPVTENKRIIVALQDLLPEVNEDAFSSLVLFSNQCSFQKIEIYSLNVEVLKVRDLKQWSKQVGGIVLSREEINSIYKVLEGYTSFKKESVQQTINSIAN